MTLKFVPRKQYLYASVEDRKKLIFPEGWDLSEIDKLPSSHMQGRRAYEGEYVNRFYGDVWLLEQVAAKVDLSILIGWALVVIVLFLYFEVLWDNMTMTTMLLRLN